MIKPVKEGIVYLAVPKPIKRGDNRVSIAPHNVQTMRHAAWDNGREKTSLTVLVEEGAGERARYTDQMYAEAGATIVSWDTIAETAHVLVDVKQREDPDKILSHGVNIFYAHVEKGQGEKQLEALISREGVYAYSPETFWVPKQGTGKLMRGTNLGFFSGVGAVHLLFQGVKLSYQARGVQPIPFDFFPVVDGATEEDILTAYGEITEVERGLKFAIIGGQNGLVSSGAQEEFKRAGLAYDLLYKDITLDQEKLELKIKEYDGIINATVWNPATEEKAADPRIITKRQLRAMKRGMVFVDNTCDMDRSTPLDGEHEGSPVIGGVRYSFETKWGDKNQYYWVGENKHTFHEENPLKIAEETHVLYNTNGMVPGGTVTAQRTSDAYFGMIYPYLVGIVRAVAQGIELPENGLVIKNSKIFHSDLCVRVKTRDDLAKFRAYCLY